jgi:hypothetical protein
MDLYLINPTGGPAINPQLAQEIGLNESILLMQIDFWLGLAKDDPDGHLKDGRHWTYQSVRSIQKRFPFWSTGTIQRIIESLIKQGLVDVGNYNRRAGDNTRWFAINLEAAGRLNSVMVAKKVGVPNWDGVSQDGTGVFSSGTDPFQNGTGVSQIGTTLPERSTENTPERSTGAGIDRATHLIYGAEPEIQELEPEETEPVQARDSYQTPPPTPSPGPPVEIVNGWKAEELERLKGIVAAEYPNAGKKGGYRPSKPDLDLLPHIPRRRAKDFVAAVKHYALKVKGEDTQFTRGLRNFLKDDFWEQFVAAPPKGERRIISSTPYDKTSASDLLLAHGIKIG